MNIITKNLDSQTPVFHQYSSQNQPQPAYIELDCRGEGELIAEWNSEIGNAVPAYYWHGLAVRWGIPSETTGDSLIALFENPDFLAICETIVAGFEKKWNGSNFVGKYTDEASEAIEEAERMIERSLEQCEVWSAEDWLFTSSSLSERWSDQPIEEAVETLKGYVENNQMIDGDLEEALISQAKSDFEYKPETLTATHIAELLKRNEITEKEAVEWKEAYQPE